MMNGSNVKKLSGKTPKTTERVTELKGVKQKQQVKSSCLKTLFYKEYRNSQRFSFPI
jgi:hypothetical protein